MAQCFGFSTLIGFYFLWGWYTEWCIYIIHVFSCNSIYPVIKSSHIVYFTVRGSFIHNNSNKGRFIEYKIQGQFTKYYRGTLKNVTFSYAGGLQNTTNRVGLKNTTSTATCLGIVGSVAVVLESVYVEVRLRVLPLVQTLSDRNNPNFVPLKKNPVIFRSK